MKIIKLILLVLACIFFSLLFTNRILSADEAVIPLESPKQAVATTTPEFENIGRCESNHNLHAKNKASSASGEYQWINSSWYKYGRELWGEEFYKKNIWSTDNRELAWYVYNKYGTSDWNASKWCWSK